MGFLKTLTKRVSSSSHLSQPASTPSKPASPSPLSRSKAPTPVPTPPATAPRIVVFGAGSRGNAYAKALYNAAAAHVVAVAEPRPGVRESFGKKYIWGKERTARDGEAFEGWEEWVVWERERREKQAGGYEGVPKGATVAFVCVLDDQHLAVVKALAELGGMHVMCEKPLATSLRDCLEMYAAVRWGWKHAGRKTVFGIGHVLRYSPHNILLRRLVREEGVIGDVMSIEHTEPVGWWHFSHSYVRGNWRKESTSAPSLLTKSCHDIDFLLWMLCSPAYDIAERPHLPSQITSSGSLRYYRRERKPLAAGAATNCLSCPAEPDCHLSAKSIYLKKHLEVLKTGWPVKIVVPDIEDVLLSQGMPAAQEHLLAILREDYGPKTSAHVVDGRTWYGRCAFEAGNDVCDDQTVVMEWKDDPVYASAPGASPVPGSIAHRGAKTAVFHMVAFTDVICSRRGRVYGTRGEIAYNSSDIVVSDFVTGKTTTHSVGANGDEGHGGGDTGLALNMIAAVEAVEKGEMDVDAAQWRYLGVDLEEVVRSHAAVFAAEDARKEGKVVEWEEWWSREVEGLIYEFDDSSDK